MVGSLHCQRDSWGHSPQFLQTLPGMVLINPSIGDYKGRRRRRQSIITAKVAVKLSAGFQASARRPRISSRAIILGFSGVGASSQIVVHSAYHESVLHNGIWFDSATELFSCCDVFTDDPAARKGLRALEQLSPSTSCIKRGPGCQHLPLAALTSSLIAVLPQPPMPMANLKPQEGFHVPAQASLAVPSFHRRFLSPGTC